MKFPKYQLLNIFTIATLILIYTYVVKNRKPAPIVVKVLWIEEEMNPGNITTPPRGRKNHHDG